MIINKKAINLNVSYDSSVLWIKAFYRNKRIGFLNCMYNEKTGVIEINDIQCKKNNRGYGSLMMQKLIEVAKEKNYKCIEGWISAVDIGHIERLHHFYKKFGFEIIPNKDGMKREDIRLRL